MPSKIFSICLAKFFLVISLKFLTCSPKLSNFKKIRSLDAPSASSCPSNDIFLFLFVILIHFLKRKLAPLDAPQGGCPGPSHRPHRLCTPLNGNQTLVHIVHSKSASMGFKLRINVKTLNTIEIIGAALGCHVSQFVL